VIHGRHGKVLPQPKATPVDQPDPSSATTLTARGPFTQSRQIALDVRRSVAPERRPSETVPAASIADSGQRQRRAAPCPDRRYGAASAYGWVGQLALEDRAPSWGRVPLASCFVPTMHRATPGTRTLPPFSNALTFAMASVRIRSRAGWSTC